MDTNLGDMINMRKSMDVMMKFNDQERSGVVTLSAAKGLARWAQRCFAALSMTLPVLVGKFHHRVPTQFIKGDR